MAVNTIALPAPAVLAQVGESAPGVGQSPRNVDPNHTWARVGPERRSVRGPHEISPLGARWVPAERGKRNFVGWLYGSDALNQGRGSTGLPPLRISKYSSGRGLPPLSPAAAMVSPAATGSPAAL